VSTALIGLLIVAPLAAVLAGIGSTGPKWEHLTETVLQTYIINTLILVVTVSLLSILFAVVPAWLVSTCEFPGRKMFEWLLVMPLAIPTYVAAFVYFQFTESVIPILVDIRLKHGVEAFIWAEMILRYGILSILLAGVLSPYLFLTVRTSFSMQRTALIEASSILGKSITGTFFSIALPLARPAIVAGLSLIIMEVVNDYGAVHFFGVPTLTEGIFRTWFDLQDRASAVRMAGLTMGAILLVLVFERTQRGKARFSEPEASSSPLTRQKLTPLPAFGALLVCLVPLGVGLIFPVYQLSQWAWLTWAKVLKPDFIDQLSRSLLLSILTAFFLTAVALLLAYAVKIHPTRWLRFSNRVSTIGYAAPGAVIAIGVMVSFGKIDDWSGKAVLSGTLFTIGFAYLVRFIAVAYQPVVAGLARVSQQMDESSRILGKTPLFTLGRIHLPILKGTLLGAAMLVFIDILKELPLTMILRPADFNTLSTTAFGLAKEGRVHECAAPSLIIVMAGAIGLTILNRYLRKT
jgi:iron(III) transport system permease protein